MEQRLVGGKGKRGGGGGKEVQPRRQARPRRYKGDLKDDREKEKDDLISIMKGRRNREKTTPEKTTSYKQGSPPPRSLEEGTLQKARCRFQWSLLTVGREREDSWSGNTESRLRGKLLRLSSKVSSVWRRETGYQKNKKKIILVRQRRSRRATENKTTRGPIDQSA